jgi:hypothetical protein
LKEWVTGLELPRGVIRGYNQDGIEINIETLQLLTQKRIISSIYKVYINHDMFPNKLFITIIKNILKKIYEIDIHTTKIYKQIMKNKNKPIINDLFLFLFNKYNKKI